MRITMALLVVSSVLLAGCSSRERPSVSQTAAPRYASTVAAPRAGTGAPRTATGEWDATLQQRVYVRDLSSPRGQRVIVREAARPARRLTQACTPCTPFTPPAPPPLPANACVVVQPCPAPAPVPCVPTRCVPTRCVPTPCAAPTVTEDCPGGNCGIPDYADPCPGGVCGIPSPAAIVRSLPNPFCK